MEARMESPTFLRRLFGDEIDRGAWRVDVANENAEPADPFDDELESVVVMVYGKRKKSRR